MDEIIKNFYVTFFDNNRSYYSEVVLACTKEEAKINTKINHPEAKFIAVHDKLPAIY